MNKRGKAFLELKKWDKSQKLLSKKNAALYIHIPFCKEICPYCLFTKFPYEKYSADIYFRSLKKEIRMYKERGFDFSNVYIGGGTPSIDMQKTLEVIYLVKGLFSIKDVSIELKIDDLTEKNVALLKSAGVTRVSVGVQSFDDKSNECLGRRNETNTIDESLKLANESFKTLNVDLIFNLPNQNIESLNKDISRIVSLGISQVTFYPLIPNKENIKFSDIDFSKEKNFYEIIYNKMIHKGYHQSSVWCFSKIKIFDDAHKNQEIFSAQKNNVFFRVQKSKISDISKTKEWVDEYFIDNHEYIGVGCGAISFTDGEIRANAFSLDKYSKRISENHLPVLIHKKLSEKEFLEYYLLTKAFGLKIEKKEFNKTFGKDLKSLTKIRIAKRFGYLKETKDSFVVSKKSLYPLSVLMREFFSSLNKLRNMQSEKNKGLEKY